jgi:hypothetical protein
MSTLREFVEMASAKIDIIFKAQGEVRPMYHFVIGAEDVVLPAPPVGKDEAVAIMRTIFKKTGTHRYVFIDEAWSAIEVASPGQTIDDMRKKMKTLTPPSKRSDRKEVVIFFAEDETEGYFAAQREIIRDADGKGTLGPLEYDNQPSVMMGRMTGLLPPKGTMQ